MIFDVFVGHKKANAAKFVEAIYPGSTHKKMAANTISELRCEFTAQLWVWEIVACLGLAVDNDLVEELEGLFLP